MSDRIAVMFEGEIGQLDDPETLYRQPKNRRVADFIGMMNFLPAKVGKEKSEKKTVKDTPRLQPGTTPTPGLAKRIAQMAGLSQPNPSVPATAPKALPEYALGVEVEVAGLGRCIVPTAQVPHDLRDADCTVGIRPETLSILFEGETTTRREVAGVVDEVVYYGDMTYYDVRVEGVEKPLTISMKNLIGREVLDVGAKTRVAWDERSLVVLRD